MLLILLNVVDVDVLNVVDVDVLNVVDVDVKCYGC